jgi:predicted enzyme related to lactoylglutathione lyase
MPTPSRFVWHDLMTNDPNASLRFYSQLFGWSSQEMKFNGRPYYILKSGDRDVGGLMPMPPGMQAPPHWLGYLDVDNVDAICDKATREGARMYMNAMDIPDVGRFAVFADPQGATIAVFRPMQQKAEKAAGERPTPGTFCWDELMTSDVSAATRFYKSLFNWTTMEVDMGQMGKYTLFQRTPGEKGTNAAGMMQKPEEAPHPFWLHYVETKDVDATARRVKELGGQVHLAPTDIPNIGRFAVCADPSGASFALFHTQH